MLRRLLAYLLVPAGIVLLSVCRYARLVDPLAASIQDACRQHTSAPSYLSCSITAFFDQTFNTDLGAAFMASLFAFIAAALTITHLEAAREFNRFSVFIKQPLLIWTLVNVITGSATFPLLLTVTLLYQARLHALGPQGKPIRQAGRHLTSAADTFSIPLAVLLGFALPSLRLVQRRTELAIGVWNLFPLLVSLLQIVVRTILHGLASRASVKPWHAEQHTASLIRLYSLPILTSAVAHFWLLSAMVNSIDELSHASHFMIVNGTSIFALYIFWIWYESDGRATGVSLFCAVCLGPGAGVSVGWILQERLPSPTLSGLPIS